MLASSFDIQPAMPGGQVVFEQIEWMKQETQKSNKTAACWGFYRYYFFPLKGSLRWKNTAVRRISATDCDGVDWGMGGEEGSYMIMHGDSEPNSRTNTKIYPKSCWGKKKQQLELQAKETNFLSSRCFVKAPDIEVSHHVHIIQRQLQLFTPPSLSLTHILIHHRLTNNSCQCLILDTAHSVSSMAACRGQRVRKEYSLNISPQARYGTQGSGYSLLRKIIALEIHVRVYTHVTCNTRIHAHAPRI